MVYIGRILFLISIVVSGALLGCIETEIESCAKDTDCPENTVCKAGLCVADTTNTDGDNGVDIVDGDNESDVESDSEEDLEPEIENPNCNSDEFECNNGSCINNELLCNGVDNCGDNSDETQDCPCMVTEDCFSSGCFEGDVYCYDNCGYKQEKQAECSDFGCVDGRCQRCIVTDDCAYRSCFEDDLYCFDNCNNRRDKAQNCAGNGCSNAGCLDCEITDNCSAMKCYSGDLWCFDNCGNRREKSEDCGGYGCEDWRCLPCMATDTCATQQCYEGDVWCYDNCGARREKNTDCEGYGCDSASCLECQVCDECAYKKCYDGAVYCYDNCDNRQARDEYCETGYHCEDGSCTEDRYTWKGRWEKRRYHLIYHHEDAVEYCDKLVLDGYDDWRMPNISELRKLIRGCGYTEYDGSCNISAYGCLDYSCANDACRQSCEYHGGPDESMCYGPDEMDMRQYDYWSSSALADDTERFWCVGFTYADMYTKKGYYDLAFVRCIRP